MRYGLDSSGQQLNGGDDPGGVLDDPPPQLWSDFSEDVCAVHQRVGVGMHCCARVGESLTGTGETFDAPAIYSE